MWPFTHVNSCQSLVKKLFRGFSLHLEQNPHAFKQAFESLYSPVSASSKLFLNLSHSNTTLPSTAFLFGPSKHQGPFCIRVFYVLFSPVGSSLTLDLQILTLILQISVHLYFLRRPSITIIPGTLITLPNSFIAPVTL